MLGGMRISEESVSSHILGTLRRLNLLKYPVY